MNMDQQNELACDGYIDRAVYKRIHQFNVARDWSKFHNPKDLAISISLEASELLECFQWSAEDTWALKQRDQMIEETADILIYACQMCQVLGVNPNEIIARKMDVNEEKYPIDLAYGSSDKYSSLNDSETKKTIQEAPIK